MNCLPITGTQVWHVLLGGAMLLGIGAVLIVVTRHRSRSGVAALLLVVALSITAGTVLLSPSPAGAQTVCPPGTTPSAPAPTTPPATPTPTPTPTPTQSPL